MIILFIIKYLEKILLIIGIMIKKNLDYIMENIAQILIF